MAEGATVGSGGGLAAAGAVASSSRQSRSGVLGPSRWPRSGVARGPSDGGWPPPFDDGGADLGRPRAAV
jgi:hypothetical protein